MDVLIIILIKKRGIRILLTYVYGSLANIQFLRYQFDVILIFTEIKPDDILLIFPHGHLLREQLAQEIRMA